MVRLSIPPFFWLLGVLLLASCGGGGGESNITMGDKGRSTPPLPPSAPAPARISRATPRPGSVTQSSNTKNGITTDKIQIVTNDPVNGSLRLMKNNKLMIDYGVIKNYEFGGTRKIGDNYYSTYPYDGFPNLEGKGYPLGVKENNFWKEYVYDIGYNYVSSGDIGRGKTENASRIRHDFLTGSGRTAKYNKIDNNLSVLEIYPKISYIGDVSEYDGHYVACPIPCPSISYLMFRMVG